MYDINYLKTIKKEKKFTNLQIAEKSGIPLGTVNKIFSGNTSVKVQTYNKLKNVLEQNDNGVSNGTVGVALCNIDLAIASPLQNAEKICQKTTEYALKGASVIAFPEMALTGTTVGDLLYQRRLHDGVLSALEYIVNYSKNINALILVGAPLIVGGQQYSVAVCFCKGKILGVTPKTNLSEEQRRYFSVLDKTKKITLCGQETVFGSVVYKNTLMPSLKVGVELSEDLILPISPSSNLCMQGANLIVNLSATPEIVGRQEIRLSSALSQSYRGICAYMLVDTGKGESTTDSVWGGHKLVAENGKLIAESKPFAYQDLFSQVDLEYIENKRLKEGFVCKEEDEVEFDLTVGGMERVYSKTPFIPTDKKDFEKRAELILTMQAEGLIKRVEHTNSKTLVLGISGGLDSALAMMVCVRAFKKLKRNLKDIIAVTMPCFGTSDRTYQNAVGLTNGLGLTLKKVEITKSVLSHFEDIGHNPQEHNTTFENAQARERTQVLMDIANKEWGLVVGTGDLSELALGWATYNGDHMSNYGVNGSIPKTLVKALVLYEADKLGGQVGKHLKDIVDTPVSPELIPTEQGKIKQKTEDLVGPYILHDFFLYHFLSSGFTPVKIYKIACQTFKGEFDEQTVYKWIVNFVKRFFAMQFKRSCLPDGVGVGSVGLSPRNGYKMPSDANCKLWLDQLEKEKII